MSPAPRSSRERGEASEASRWIAFDTVTTRPTGGFASFLRKRFRRLGFRVRLQPARRDGLTFHNFLAWRGPSGGRPLLLNTHMDTVPPGPLAAWTATGGNPWRARVRNGLLYGLGAVDVKLNLYCQWRAFSRWGRKPFRRPVCVAGTFGEESGLRGAIHLATHWGRRPKPLFALVGEPSELRPVDRHRGYLVFEWDLPRRTVRLPAGRTTVLRARGRAAHSATPERGSNALGLLLRRLGRGALVTDLSAGAAPNLVPAEAAASVRRPSRSGRPVRVDAVPWTALADWYRRLPRLFSRRFTATVTLVRPGKTPRAVFDVRTPPGTSHARVRAAVRRALARLCRAHGVPFRCRVERDNPALSRLAGPGRGLVERALRRSDLPVRWDAKPTCTEAGVYRRWGVPSAVWGPGRSLGNAHRPNERVPLKDLEKAAAFYYNLLVEWCAKPS
jgi:succinyl-diaminopimelate desuccinylase